MLLALDCTFDFAINGQVFASKDLALNGNVLTESG
jgi:hypothetical protein